MNKFDVLVIGCGLSGMVIARQLAEKGKRVHIIEKRDHIGGNIYDYVDENNILVQKYGPHVFFTDSDIVRDYVAQFTEIDYFYPECRTYINNTPIPMPFNFASIDLIYEDKKVADALKRDLIAEFGEDSIVSVLDVINSSNQGIHQYGVFMYENEYRKYTSKQWDLPIESIDPAVFMRVPVYISYKKSYVKEKEQFMPRGGFTAFAKKLLEHNNISLELNCDALSRIKIDSDSHQLVYDGEKIDKPVVYTGPLDQLFDYRYGELSYRALEFVWKTISKEQSLETPLSAFPEGDKYIRITDYTQFPPQESGDIAVIAIEFPVRYSRNELCGNEPYYPVLTEETKAIYKKYKELANQTDNLYVCGRLAEFRYYNMDAVILRALDVAKEVLG